jgi:hypothetical protein
LAESILAAGTLKLLTCYFEPALMLVIDMYHKEYENFLDSGRQKVKMTGVIIDDH